MTGKIKEFFIKRRNADSEIDEDASLIEAGLLDSFLMIELIVYLEKTFGIKIEAADLMEDKMNSIKGIERVVAAKLQKK